MEWEQIDLFGGGTPLKKKAKRQCNAMQARFGVMEDKICARCTHCVPYNNGNRIRHKCEICTGSKADVKPRGAACGKYQTRYD